MKGGSGQGPDRGTQAVGLVCGTRGVRGSSTGVAAVPGPAGVWLWAGLERGV